MSRSLFFCGLIFVASSAHAQEVSTESVDAVVAKVNRHVTNLERQMAQEEKRLQTKMAQIAQMRKSALEKEDAKALKAIESMEEQAFKTYEGRMKYIISQMEGDPSKAKAATPSRKRQSNRVRSSSSRTQRKVYRRRSVSKRSTAGKGYRR